MLILFIFYIHIVGAVIAFTKRWQDEGLGDGILILAFMGLIFAIGWTLVVFVIHFIAPRGIPKILDSDSLSLLLLTIGETTLYYFYFFRKEKSDGKPKETIENRY
jgi:hypothetical protein